MNEPVQIFLWIYIVRLFVSRLQCYRTRKYDSKHVTTDVFRHWSHILILLKHLLLNYSRDFGANVQK